MRFAKTPAFVAAILLALGASFSQEAKDENEEATPLLGGGVFFSDPPERPPVRKVPADDAEPVTLQPDEITVELMRREEAARQAFRRAKVVEIEESFDAVPLREVIETLVGKIGLRVRFAEPFLYEDGIDLSEPATLKFDKVTLFEALQDITDRYEIAFSFTGRRVLATTLGNCDDVTEVRFYPVGDLTLTTEEDGRRFYDAEPLIQLIESTTSGPWFHIDAVGGTVTAYDAEGLHLLVVRQANQVQEETEDLLSRLREIRRQGREGQARETYRGEAPATGD